MWSSFVAARALATLAAVNPSASVAQRSAQAEALADKAEGKPARLYYRREDGVVPTGGVSGVTDCLPGSAARHGIFVHLPEADGAEGKSYSIEENRALEAAWRFARDYSQTTLRERMTEITSICPGAQPYG